VAALLGAAAVAWARARVPAALFGTAAALSVWFGAHLVAVGVRALLVSLLNSHERYFAHPVASGSGFALAIASIAVGRHPFGVVAVPIGLLAGETLAIAVLACFARTTLGLRLRPSIGRPEPVRRFVRLVAADVAGATITRINPVIDQLVAATAGVVGGGTILRYAMEVGAIPTTLLQATVLPALLGRLSRQAAGGSPWEIEKTVGSLLATIAGLLGLCACVLVITRKAVLRAAFLHGHMDAAAVDAMVAILPWALAGSVPFGSLLVLARAHVALQNTRLMLPLGVLNASLNLVLDLVLVRFTGLAGIALATSLVHAIVAVVFWRALRLKLAQ
jgi:putative peptidoglycan lipid II flippase